MSTNVVANTTAPKTWWVDKRGKESNQKHPNAYPKLVRKEFDHPHLALVIPAL